MIFLGSGAEQFGKDWLQSIGPNLVSLESGVEPVTHHPVEEHVVLVGEFVIDIQIADGLAVCELRKILVNPVDHRHHRHVVVARENSHQNDRCSWRFRAHDIEDCLETLRDIRRARIVSIRRGPVADVIRSGKQNNYFGIDAVQFTVVETPEDVLGCIRPPAKIRRIPSEEILLSSLRAIPGSRSRPIGA